MTQPSQPSVSVQDRFILSALRRHVADLEGELSTAKAELTMTRAAVAQLLEEANAKDEQVPDVSTLPSTT